VLLAAVVVAAADTAAAAYPHAPAPAAAVFLVAPNLAVAAAFCLPALVSHSPAAALSPAPAAVAAAERSPAAALLAAPDLVQSCGLVQRRETLLRTCSLHQRSTQRHYPPPYEWACTLVGVARSAACGPGLWCHQHKQANKNPPLGPAQQLAV